MAELQPAKEFIRIAYGAYLRLVQTKPDYLFVVAHKRSGSSVLDLILNSNADIAGCGELRQQYRTDEDLFDLMVRVGLFFRLAQIPPIVLNKVVTNENGFGEEVLRSPRTKFVFLLRTPAPTLASLLDFWDSGEETALRYYTGRLAEMARLAAAINDKERAAFLTHDQLLHRSADVLASLQAWLKLREPLSTDYNVHRGVGKWKLGDTSPLITTGRLDPDADSKRVHPPVSESCTWQAEPYYANCFEVLSRFCTPLVP